MKPAYHHFEKETNLGFLYSFMLIVQCTVCGEWKKNSKFQDDFNLE